MNYMLTGQFEGWQCLWFPFGFRTGIFQQLLRQRHGIEFFWLQIFIYDSQQFIFVTLINPDGLAQTLLQTCITSRTVEANETETPWRSVQLRHEVHILWVFGKRFWPLLDGLPWNIVWTFMYMYSYSLNYLITNFFLPAQLLALLFLFPF